MVSTLVGVWAVWPSLAQKIMTAHCVGPLDFQLGVLVDIGAWWPQGTQQLLTCDGLDLAAQSILLQ
jgi:hypothetical protein